MRKLSFRLQVLLGFLISVILVFTVGYISHRSIRKLQYNEAFTEHSHLLINTSKDVLQLLTDCETGSRGYIATGEKKFLEPYFKALPVIAAKKSTFSALYTIIPEQKKDLIRLQLLIDEKLGQVADNVNAKNNSGNANLAGMLNGKRIMDNVRILNQRIIDREQKALNSRRSSIQNTIGDTLHIIDYGSMVFFILVIVMLYYIQKTYTRQKLQEEEVKHINYELSKVVSKNEAKNWLLTGTAALNEKLQGQQTESQLSENILNEVCSYTGATSGTFYLQRKEDGILELAALYAYHNPDNAKKIIKMSEGWVGQTAKNKRSATIKGNFNTSFYLETSLINKELAEIYITPVFFNKKLIGVMEFAFQETIPEATLDYINLVIKDIGVALNTATARMQMQSLYEETQQQAEELESQQEEMRVTNEELLTKTEMLQASEEELKVQQEELRTINNELEEKAKLMEEKNQVIEEARLDVSRKVEELEITGRYKSEFLANMSHELRTPLNSILVLARILKDNKAENLSTDQVKYANVIFNAGNDLLTLINDILDLAKIESGKMELQNERISIEGILGDIEMLFHEVATNKQIKFSRLAENVPQFILADKMRIEQVIKNLLSNAFKFTPAGGTVTLTASPGKNPDTIAFKVKDSGIGIPPEKQKLIFEAFQQADGSTSRQYGGTGLGLSISRELAGLLGGSLSLSSEAGMGSEFTITIPVTAAKADTNHVQEEFPEPRLAAPAAKAMPALPRAENVNTHRPPFVVIVEDDQNFAEILENYASEYGYKSVLVNEGMTAVKVITENMPDAVILDIMLPGKDGWQILKELKQQPETRHIPVHLMSAGEAPARKVKSAGAISFMKKPIKAEAIDKLFGEVLSQTGEQIKQILLVEDHYEQSDALRDLMQKQGIGVEQAFTGEQAYNLLQKNSYQCVILDLNLPDIFGLDLLDKIKAEERFASLPVIINTAMELDKSAITRLMHYSNAMVVKTGKSSDRLIDEVNLFLHKLNTSSPAPVAAAPKRASGLTRESLKGKKVLLVDDDMRNIFALSSALQTFDLLVEIANDGEEALEKLADNADIDLVLMDIMMPVMDGYEAMRTIRLQNKWAKLPIIALTAKAMKDDREKCIAAGANDYITKPVDIDRLISLIQLWMEG